MAKAPNNSELLNQTIKLIENRPRPVTYAHIAEKTGVPLQFLQDLMAGRIKNPGVVRIEAIYNFLAKTKLTLAA